MASSWASISTGLIGCTKCWSSLKIHGISRAGYHQRTKHTHPVGLGGSLRRKMPRARLNMACVRGYHHHCGMRSAKTVASSPMITRYPHVITSGAATRANGFDAQRVSVSGIRCFCEAISVGPKVVIAAGAERLWRAIRQAERHATARLDSANAPQRTLKVCREGLLQPGDGPGWRCEA